MSKKRPFSNVEDLIAKGHEIWKGLSKEDWLEAFSHHPRIGDVGKLREKFASTSKWAENEQEGVQSATEETLKQLAEGNKFYEVRFGMVFLVCATGKSADQMLELLKNRLQNDPIQEQLNAAAEQSKITEIRIKKLFFE